MIYTAIAAFVGLIALRQLVRIHRERRAHDQELARRFRFFEGQL